MEGVGPSFACWGMDGGPVVSEGRLLGQLGVWLDLLNGSSWFASRGRRGGMLVVIVRAGEA